MNLARTAILTGSVLLFLAVLIGAFGAHALGHLLEQNQRVDVFETASRYHFYHGLSLILVGVIIQLNKGLVHQSLMYFLMLFGTLLFCGSLYCLAIFNTSWLGVITPIGGVLLLCAWLLLANAARLLSISDNVTKE